MLLVMLLGATAARLAHAGSEIGILENAHEGAGDLGGLGDAGNDAGMAEGRGLAGHALDKFPAGSDIGGHDRNAGREGFENDEG